MASDIIRVPPDREEKVGPRSDSARSTASRWVWAGRREKHCHLFQASPCPSWPRTSYRVWETPLSIRCHGGGRGRGVLQHGRDHHGRDGMSMAWVPWMRFSWQVSSKTETKLIKSFLNPKSTQAYPCLPNSAQVHPCLPEPDRALTSLSKLSKAFPNLSELWTTWPDSVIYSFCPSSW